jgi:predicted N-formylglutamate amidohydrolase
LSRDFDAIVLTCEHGGHAVPRAYKSLFRGQASVLSSHRGWDIGALAVAQGLARTMNLPLHFCTTTRLLVDVNRSLKAKDLWSDWSAKLDRSEKEKILDQYYLPYRNEVRDHLMQLIAQGMRVLHLSIHSFTAILNGETRNTEVGILYDPKRNFEAGLARSLVAAVREQKELLRVRKNYPYLGYSDGFTSFLRRQLPVAQYAGIEIETKQDEIATKVGQDRYINLYYRAIQSL